MWRIQTIHYYSKDFYSIKKVNGLLNHIHDPCQLFEVLCSSGKLLRTSVLINGRLRDEDRIYYSLIRDGASIDDLADFSIAYDQWFELYNTPILTESANPIITDVNFCQKETNIMTRIKNIFYSISLPRAEPLQNDFTIVESL